MEPKDLKNSEELEHTLSDDAELKKESESDIADEKPEGINADPFSTAVDLSDDAGEPVIRETADALIVSAEPAEQVAEVTVSDLFEEVKTAVETRHSESSEPALGESAVVLPEEMVSIEDQSVPDEAEVKQPESDTGEEEKDAVEKESSVVKDTKKPRAASKKPKVAKDFKVVSEEQAIPEVKPGESSEAEMNTPPSDEVQPEVKITPVEESKPAETEIAAEENQSLDVTKQEGEVKPSEDVISEVENIVDSSEKGVEEVHEPDVEEFLESAEVNYDQAVMDNSQLSQIDLVNMMREVVDATPGETDYRFESIVAAYYRKSREINEELKNKFIADGGAEVDFIAGEDPYKNDVKELLKKYRQVRTEQLKKLDAEKENNLQKKYELIEEIKNLLNKEESINRTFQEFRDLQKHWYEIGQVPQSKMKDLWDTYHFHVENFYDYIKINKELRDLDLKKNLEAKIEICEKTEELLMEPSIIRAFNSLQKFHEEWREIGPVPTDKKDDIWERFKAATSKINQKHQEYFEKRKLDQKKNLDAKIALCEKAEEISLENFEIHRQWDEKSRELVELQKVWKTIGFAPKRENNRIYDRFRAACDKFFINKRDFYSKNKDYQQTNLQMKIDLCLEAENLKENTDWKKVTQQFIDIQKRWKEIGPVPRKSSDLIWKRFRAACDYFFERKAVHFSDIDEEQSDNLKLKEQLITDVENFKADNDAATSLKTLREFQRRWTEIGHVPLRYKDAIQHRFREAIDRQFDALKIDNSNRNVFNFRSKIESLTDNARGLSKVRSEREKYMIKLKQLENDLILLDNNIGFFANSKNAQALIADVNQKIQDTRDKIEQLKEKIRIIDDLDKSEY